MSSILCMTLWVCDLKQSLAKATYNLLDPRYFFKVSPPFYTDCSYIPNHFSLTSVWLLTSSDSLRPQAPVLSETWHLEGKTHYMALKCVFSSGSYLSASSRLHIIKFLQKPCQYVHSLTPFLGKLLVMLCYRGLSKRSRGTGSSMDGSTACSAKEIKAAVGRQLECLFT